MFETSITLVGNLVDPPKYRSLSSGTTLTTFRVASTSRRFDKSTDAWVDGDILFVRVSLWRQLADNAKQCLSKGDPVIVTGRVFTRFYEDDKGVRRTSVELDASSIGFDLGRGLARFTNARPSDPVERTDPAAEPDEAERTVEAERAVEAERTVEAESRREGELVGV